MYKTGWVSKFESLSERKVRGLAEGPKLSLIKKLFLLCWMSVTSFFFFFRRTCSFGSEVGAAVQRRPAAGIVSAATGEARSGGGTAGGGRERTIEPGRVERKRVEGCRPKRRLGERWRGRWRPGGRLKVVARAGVAANLADFAGRVGGA